MWPTSDRHLAVRLGQARRQFVEPFRAGPVAVSVRTPTSAGPPPVEPSSRPMNHAVELALLGLLATLWGASYSFIKLGVKVPGGSDAPVERGEPMIEFYAAVARRPLTRLS